MTREELQAKSARLAAAIATLKGWGWTSGMIDAAYDAHPQADEALAFFKEQVAAGEEANRAGIASMRSVCRHG